MRPHTVVFDVNETLSDLGPLAERFAEVGAPRELAPLWFAATLREGFALTAAGSAATFATIGAAVAGDLLADVTLDRDPDSAAEFILEGFLRLPVHPDVPRGVTALRAAGLRLATMSNGGRHVAEKLLGRSGLRHHFDHVLSVDDAGAWKPAAAAYGYAARMCGRRPGELLMVAVHPWDLHGAARAGFTTAWINRGGHAYPSYLPRPDHTVRTLGELVPLIAG